MPFEESKVEMFMGGNFSLDHRDYTPKALADEFRAWARELDDWDQTQKIIAEFSPGTSTIDVTMEQGMAQ